MCAAVQVLLESSDSIIQITAKAEEVLATTPKRAGAAADAKSPAPSAAASGTGPSPPQLYAMRAAKAHADVMLRQQNHVRTSKSGGGGGGGGGGASNGADSGDDEPAADAKAEAKAAGAGIWLPEVKSDDARPFDAAAFLAERNRLSDGAPLPMTKATCLQIFKSFDTNGDGSIDSDELESLCAATGVKPWRAMKELDTDSDGKISEREFMEWWARDRDRCRLEDATGISYEHVAMFRARPMQRLRASRNLSGGGGGGDEKSTAAESKLAASTDGLVSAVGSQLSRVERLVAPQLTPTQRSQFTAKFRAVQHAITELEKLILSALDENAKAVATAPPSAGGNTTTNGGGDRKSPKK